MLVLPQCLIQLITLLISSHSSHQPIYKFIEISNYEKAAWISKFLYQNPIF